MGNGVIAGELGTGLIVDNGQLVIQQPGKATLNNAVNGTGSLIQAGSGTLTLAAKIRMAAER